MPPAEEVRRRSHSDYIFGKVLGEGSFSTVYLAKDVHTSKEHASKSIKTMNNFFLKGAYQCLKTKFL